MSSRRRKPKTRKPTFRLGPWTCLECLGKEQRRTKDGRGILHKKGCPALKRPGGPPMEVTHVDEERGVITIARR